MLLFILFKRVQCTMALVKWSSSRLQPAGGAAASLKSTQAYEWPHCNTVKTQSHPVMWCHTLTQCLPEPKARPLARLIGSFQGLRSCWLIIAIRYSERSCLLWDLQLAVTVPLGRLKRKDQRVSWCQQRTMSSTHHGFIRAWCNQGPLDQSQNKGWDK